MLWFEAVAAWDLNMMGCLQGKAVRELLAHRLSPRNSQEAKTEWYEIVEGQHQLWEGVSEPYKHTIRAFLVHFHTQILRASSERFCFRNGSVGQCGCYGAPCTPAIAESSAALATQKGNNCLKVLCTCGEAGLHHV